MATSNTDLAFSAYDLNMWGTGTAGINQTWEMWALNQHLTWGQRFGIGFDVGIASASGSIGVNAVADAKLGLVATLQGTTGDVDINYHYGANIYAPDVALAGSKVEINTANWWADNESIVSHSPNFQFDLGLAYQFDVSASVDYQDSYSVLGGLKSDSGSGNIWSTAFGTGGVKTLPIVHLGMNPDAAGTAGNYFDFSLFDYHTSLAGDASFNFDNWLGLPVAGFLSLPRGVDTSATNTTPTQNDTFAAYGKGAPFFQFGVDVDQLVGYFFGFDTSALSGNISLPFGAGNLSYTILDMDLVYQLALAQKFTFNPDDIAVKMTSSLGETKWGVLGNTFSFNTPASGTGDLTFSTDYYLQGTLTNNTGVNGTVLVKLDVLDFGKIALLKQDIPLLSNDMWLFNKDIPVDMGTQHNDFTVHYSDDVARSSGTNAQVLGSDNTIEFDIQRVSDFTMTLTGLDSLVLVTLITSRPGYLSNYQYLFNTHTTGGGYDYDATYTLSLKDLPSGNHYKIIVSEINSNGLVGYGDASAAGFNVDYAITRANSAPIFTGIVPHAFGGATTTHTVTENHSFVYNYGNAFYDQDIANVDSLTYTITQANGSALPAWMQVDTVNKTITMNPVTGAPDAILRLVATDESGISASADVTFSTPAPADNAGNNTATAKAIGTILLDAYSSVSDYAGIDDDMYDYYSFSINSTSNISIKLANDTTSASLEAVLLASDGTTVITNTSGLAAGSYYVRVQANSGHSDYNLSIKNSVQDLGGSSSSPVNIALGNHYYVLQDYVSTSDTSDEYKITLDTKAWGVINGLDTSYSHGWNGYVYRNGVYSGGGTDQSYWDAELPVGDTTIALSPSSWVVTTPYTYWVSTGFGSGYWKTTYTDTNYTYNGFTSASLAIDRLPVLANAIPDKEITVLQPFSFSLANNTFYDADGDAIKSVTATLEDGSPLPSWLKFDSSNMTFNGLAQNIVDPISVKVVATFNHMIASNSLDYQNALSVTDIFKITAVVSDNVGNSTTTAQIISVSNQTALNPVPSSDGNDYFALQLDHTAPIAINFAGVATTATIELLAMDGTVLETATADANGNLQLITGSLLNGEYFLHLQTAATPRGYLLTIDGNYQVTPSSKATLDENSDSGLFNTDSITADNTPLLTGTATADVNVLIFDNNTKIGETTADSSGKWSFITSALNDGSYNLITKAQDVAGNLSVASQTLSVTIDTQAPNPSSLPEAITTFIAELSDKPLSILTGTAEVGATVTLNDGSVLLGGTLVKSTGEWSFALPELTDGAHTITSFVFDVAGNKSIATDLNITTVNFDTAVITTSDDQLLVGNGWFNVVSFKNATAGITLNLTSELPQTTGFGNKTLVSIEGIIGSQFNDFIQGNDDANIIDGNGGIDILAGGKGNDVYIVHSNSEIVSERSGEGIDSIISTTSDYSLGENIENLGLDIRDETTALNGTGNALNNIITGNANNNVLAGGAGDDTINAGAGNDTIDGGSGDDTVIFSGNFTEYTDSIQWHDLHHC